MDKARALQGTCEVRVGDQVYPVQFGMHAVEEFCGDMGVSFYNFFGLLESAVSGDMEVPLPRNPMRFFAAMLKAGINWPRIVEGKEPITMVEAYQIAEAVGGNLSHALMQVYTVFIVSVTPYFVPKEPTAEPAKKKARKSR